MAAAGSFRIDQVVHGYARGHREVARSLDLDDDSRATMVVMSDLLIDRVLEEGASYLACYPLPSAARHVLARTWPAGPDYRPGSVWTHSLLVDYPALAQIHDLSGLLELLRRPSEKLAGFGEAVAFSPTAGRQLGRIDDRAAAVAIAGLYVDGGGQTVPVPAGEESGNEALAMALWRQAWPGLRRDFGFVTGISDRAIPVQASCALRFTRSLDAAPDLDAGQRALLSDLPAAGPTALRTFLSRYVVEAVDPRGAAPKVAAIWIDSGSDGGMGATTLAKLARSEGLPRLKRDLVSAELEASIGGEGLVDLVREFRDESVAVLPAAARSRLADLNPQQLRRVLAAGSNADEGTLGRLSFDEVLSTSDTVALAGIADRGTRPVILRDKPAVALVRGFWPDEDAERAALVAALPSELAADANGIMSAMGGAIGPLAAAALTAFVMRTYPRAVAGLMAGGGPSMRRAALAAVGADPELAAQLASELGTGDLDLLETVAEAIVASGSGLGSVAAWVGVVRRVMDGQSAGPGPFASAVMCALALRLGGPDGLNLALPVFEAVLTSARHYSLSRDCDRWLEREIPSTARGWSLQMRLRSAAVEAWPPQHDRAGVLLLCSQSANASDVIDDTMVRHGRPALEAALLDQRLPRMARDRIKEKLSPPKRFGLFGLW
jgi:hypothetical protein